VGYGVKKVWGNPVSADGKHRAEKSAAVFRFFNVPSSTSMTNQPIADHYAELMAAAVLDEDRKEFNSLAQDAVADLGAQGASFVLGTKVPVLLPKKAIPLLIRWQVGDGDAYEDAVVSFLAELLQTLLTNGLNGSYFAMHLRLTPATWAWVERNYNPAAAACCRPYVLVANG
jgi:hypothetical protein